MQPTKKAVFASKQPLAILPKAIGMAFVVPASRANARIGDTEVVDIQGPLTSQDEGLFDSYARIRDRVQQACLSDAPRVALLINSPGGEVHGCFQLSRDIRAMCEQAGKPLVAYIDATGCSAAYALACAATLITLSETSTCGSIGVLTERLDTTEAMARDGVKVQYVSSGSKKTFGNPETVPTDAELQDTQRQVNNLGAMFCELVSQRRALPVVQVVQMEAGTFIGQEAVSAGLADRVGTFESLFVESTSEGFSEDALTPKRQV